MRPLLKIMAALTFVFLTIFLIGQLFGILTVDRVRGVLEAAQQVDPVYIFGAIVILLLLDILLSVPTLATTLLAGFFLGFPIGAAAVFTGLTFAMLTGYTLSRKYGHRAISILIKDETERALMAEAFARSGPAMIMLARAAPMVPEVTACMAGVTRMPLPRYLIFYALGTIPYVGIAAYAGSVSSLDNPQPAIFTALGLYALLWTGWFIYQRVEKRKKPSNPLP
ncbi:TVP38/TMEM64 family protein [Parasphingorhabdus cellanae]|uniref:TVP38/TMEM64 family membrane protein n=1 Tax=Parasphingorhabdus cellanae TaxID=2806553 RepID=A0ABX7T9K2_9SPHN|nr:VTT domain-containing protein [Parasphingorhabdus cellanae]QTD56758.1 VTT domain-containing protein [Parasphingorhabdus cellanae]